MVRLTRARSILVLASLLVLLVACVEYCPMPEPTPGGTPETPDIPPGQEDILPPLLTREAGAVVPGRVRVVLDESLWREEFGQERPEITPRGLERLNLSRELSRVLDCYSLERVWRTFPQLERTENGRTRVLSYAEWVVMRRSERGMRANGRPYEPPDLPELPRSFELKLAEGVDLNRLLRELSEVPGVISAELVIEPIPDAPFFPNDPGWVDPSDPSYDQELARGRWGFHNTGSELSPDYLLDFDIDAPEAWDAERGDPGVVVAVFDNGVDVTHEDIYLNIFLNNGEVPTSIVNLHKGASAEDGLPNELTFYDLNVPTVVTALNTPGCRSDGDPCTDTNNNGYIDGEDVTQWWVGPPDDSNGYPDDLVGWDFFHNSNTPFQTGDADHGTPVAGLIAAVADNGTGIAGVAHRVRILPVRASSNIDKIVYAIDFPAVRIINESSSYGFTGPSESAIDAILGSLEAEGVSYVASLGNHDAFTYGNDPSRREAVVSVNNFQSDGSRAVPGSSDWGPKTDVAAPGKGMYSLSARTTSAPGGTRSFGGTSAAAPVASGVAALIASQDDTLTPEQIRQVLRMTASDPAAVPSDRGENTPGWDLYSGWGMVNAEAAVTAVSNGTVFPEANILSLPVNYRNYHRGDEFSIQTGSVDIRAYLGLPAGGTVDWTLRRSTDWDLAGAVDVTSQAGASYSDGTAPIHTINTGLLPAGRNVLELEVTTTQGIAGMDRAVIDLPRAYIANLIQGQLIVHNRPLEGFAYGPGFVQYRIQIAPGWSPAPGDFVDVYVSTTEQAPTLPVDPGEYAEAKTLLANLDIFSLPITLPASGEATIRVLTEGASNWTFDETVIIDNTQPPAEAGFPYDYGTVYTAVTGGATTVDMDGDGYREIVVAGRFVIPLGGGIHRYQNAIYAIRVDGTPLPNWPVDLPPWEFPARAVAAGDIDDDGRPEIVVRAVPDWGGETSAHMAENVRVFNHDGTENTAGWPITLDNPNWSIAKSRQDAPVLADVTLDGRLDVLVTIPLDPPNEPVVSIRAFAKDGTALQTYAATANHAYITQPAVGDVDGDGENEVAAVAYTMPVGGSAIGPATLHVWELDGTLAWTSELKDLNSGHCAPPVLFDVDEDGSLEIVAAPGIGQVSVYESDGTLLSASSGGNPLYPKFVAAQFDPGTASADRDVVFAYRAFQSGSFAGVFNTAFNAQTGVVLPGWSGGVNVAGGDVCYHPMVADVDGDESLETISGDCVPPTYYDVDLPHYILNATDPTGDIVTNGGEWPLHFPFPVASTPVASDLDGDGGLELVVQTSGGGDTRLYVYDLPSPSGPGHVAWGEYGHDPRRSGNYHGDLRLLSPTTAQNQSVGPYNDPASQALLLVRTHFARGAPVGSEDAERWTVAIGAQTAPIREVARVQGEHWLLVEPVSQPAAGTYTLHVEFDDGGVHTWDRYRDAVQYEPMAQTHSQVVVVDRSGSMSYADKLPAAIVAARFFAEAAASADEVGVVSYNSAADDELGSGVLNAGANRTPIADAITALTAQGTTSIGAGIQEATKILNNTATSTNNWGVVLLSDGLENTAPFWSRPGSLPPVRPDVQSLMASHPEFAIHTVALGPDADQGLLEDIALFTGGRFYPVYLGNSLSVFNRLADVYHYAREEVEGSQRLLTHGAEFAAGSAWQGNFYAPLGTRRLQIGLNWDRPSEQALPFSVKITRPDLTVVQPSDPGVAITTNRTDVVVTIAAPDPGVWQVSLVSKSEESFEALVVVSAVSPVGDGLVVGPVAISKDTPSSSVMAYATDDSGFVRAVSFTLDVTYPDKTVKRYVLTDDGKGGDDVAGDGIFSTRVSWDQPGSYLLTATGRGEGSLGDFRVTDSFGYFNLEGTDRDADGLPDAWERRYAPDCIQWLDPRRDLDGDGLDNITEWRFESHPLMSDTDGDGIGDGDEYSSGTDPNA